MNQSVGADNRNFRADLALVAGLIPPGSRVLDLGCGSGVLLQHLIDDCQCTGTGVEIEPASVLTAIERGVPVIELDLDTELGEFRDDSYDVVVLSRTLQALRRPEAVLTEMARISDRLIVSMPNFGLWRHRVRLLRGRMPKSKDLPYDWYDTPNLHHSTLVDLERLFRAVGLDIETRVPLAEDGTRAALGARWPNLLAGAAIYVLRRPPSRKGAPT